MDTPNLGCPTTLPEVFQKFKGLQHEFYKRYTRIKIFLSRFEVVWEFPLGKEDLKILDDGRRPFTFVFPKYGYPRYRLGYPSLVDTRDVLETLDL